MTGRTLLAAALSAVVTGSAALSGPANAPGPDVTFGPPAGALGLRAAGVTGRGAPPAHQLPDSAARLLAQGRHWGASRLLRAELAPLATASLSDRFRLAQAEAGWGNWAGALRALEAGDIDEAGAPQELWYLLGRARRATGDDSGAAAALGRFVASGARLEPTGGAVEAAETEGGAHDTHALVALALLTLAHAHAEDFAESRLHLGELALRAPLVADWTALEAARSAASTGAPADAARYLEAVADVDVRGRGWRFESDAWAARGDTSRALDVLAQARPPGQGARTEQLGREWRYRLALGDSTGAVASMEALLGRTTRGGEALAAARAHWRVASGSGPAILRRVALAMGSAGEFGPAALAWRVATQRGAVLDESDRMALARAHNGSGNPGAAVELYRELSVSDDAAVAAAALDAWIAIRTRQGRHDDARTLQERLLARYPASRQALDIVFFRADDLHDARSYDDAIREYSRAASLLPAADRAGLSRMRWGQIHLTRGEPRQAAQVFRSYLDDYPTGRRWEEASYWAVRAARESGDSTGTGDILDRLLRQGPASYYAHLAAEAEGVDLTAGLARAGAPRLPPWLGRELDLLDVLDEVGLGSGAEAHLAVVRTTALDTVEVALGLAAELVARGRALDGIRVGLALREAGEPWSRELLEAVYPFPHRALITERAEELGLDPWLVAGLIRQESVFMPRIGSHAGAIGLMQVMPATGRQLARAEGIPDYTTESLRTAEINVLLGTTFLAELMGRYDGHLPLVLSGYNAGPSRASRWRRFPEAADPQRLVERIPFVETRGYVKNVVRNQALYQWLYASS